MSTQRELSDFCDREIITRASSLVENLLRLNSTLLYKEQIGCITWENIENLTVQVVPEELEDELEELRLDEDFDEEEWMEDNCEYKDQEIFEWYFVGRFMFDNLRDAGEPVIDSDYGYLWGRTTTGQAIYMDDVIAKIYDNLGKEKQDE